MSQERDHYYSQSAYLVDITLLAPSTLGTKFREQLQNGRLTHVLASAHLLRSMKSGHAESFDLLRSQLESERVQLVGGLDEERWTSWMTPLQLHRYFEQGLQSYCDLELPRPQVFARYSQGMQAEIPMQLLPFEYQGALLFDWEQELIHRAIKPRSLGKQRMALDWMQLPTTCSMLHHPVVFWPSVPN